MENKVIELRIERLIDRLEIKVSPDDNNNQINGYSETELNRLEKQLTEVFSRALQKALRKFNEPNQNDE